MTNGRRKMPAPIRHSGFVIRHSPPEGTMPRPRIDIDAKRLTLELGDDELAQRIAAWQPPPLSDAGGVFARYRALVGSASEGAVLLPDRP